MGKSLEFATLFGLMDLPKPPTEVVRYPVPSVPVVQVVLDLVLGKMTQTLMRECGM